MADIVRNIIDAMRPISLDEMDSVKLLNRTDTKYVFRRSQLPDVLAEIAQNYAVLHINGTPYQNYKTTYFDTVNDQMYIDHQNGKLNRYKIRHRTYLSTGAEFLEIKYKNNKRRTKKKRISFPIANPLTEANSFIRNNSPYSGEDLSPKTLVEYTRLTLVDLVHGERCTVDTNLKITNCVSGEEADFSHICIIELKRDKTSAVSYMQGSLLKNRIFRCGMSKYAIGTAVTYKNIKKNRFKKKIRFIEKLKYNN
ncbi:MAG: polyphosphate polymerase domain-containing protein [Bacteroidales bacterium]|nr:polyphosphate polymerase domain-containing protein [Bacteroidales bacterium]